MKKLVVAFTLLIALLATPLIHSKASSIDFKDVPESHWAYEYIMAMRDKGVITGYKEDNTFRPENFIRRDHVAVIFTRSLDLKEIYPAKTFVDVPSNYMYAEQIKKVQQAGIFDGTNGKFRPEENITRAQMAKVLTNAFGLESKKTTSFSDVPNSHWANEYIGALVDNGITTGNNGKFKPEDNVTRAQFSAFMYRALEYKEKNEPEPPKEPEPILLPEIHKVYNDNPDLFMNKAPINEQGFINHPIVQKVFLEGMDAVRTSGLKFFTYDEYNSALMLTSEGYTNPAPNLGRMKFSFTGVGNNEGTFSYDFRSGHTQFLAEEWLKLAFPELEELIPILEKKVNEARIADEEKIDFINREKFTVGKYEVVMGVISYKRQIENMRIEISYME